MSRKYRQPGYMDYDKDDRDRGGSRREPTKPKQPSAGPRWRNAQDGPHTPRMAGTKTVARCYNCGALLPALSRELGQCGKCQADLRCCKMCVHFDPASRLECTQPIEASISPKDARNDCEFFSLKSTVEKDTSGLGGVPPVNGPRPALTASDISSKTSPNDARRAFENLFKK